MIKVSDRVRNTTFRSKTGIADVGEKFAGCTRRDGLSYSHIGRQHLGGRGRHVVWEAGSERDSVKVTNRVQ